VILPFLWCELAVLRRPDLVSTVARALREENARLDQDLLSLPAALSSSQLFWLVLFLLKASTLSAALLHSFSSSSTLLGRCLRFRLNILTHGPSSTLGSRYSSERSFSKYQSVIQYLLIDTLRMNSWSVWVCFVVIYLRPSGCTKSRLTGDRKAARIIAPFPYLLFKETNDVGVHTKYRSSFEIWCCANTTEQGGSEWWIARLTRTGNFFVALAFACVNEPALAHTSTTTQA
jgi:hypothetical protein